MSQHSGVMIVMEHTSLSGKIGNCRSLEVYGYIDGEVNADRIIVHDTGRLYGTVNAGDIEVNGDLQGEVNVANLIKIGRIGSVSGNVQYGQMAVEAGGNLTADVRNIPPNIAGDLDVTVRRGQHVRITPMDLTAIDPDDTAQDLKFTVSNAKSGFIARAGAATVALSAFTQAELQSGVIMFVHDGSGGSKAGFDVVVTDAQGANSGDPQTVNVNVQ
ncbi:MAG: cadherin-like domain-containing protein [Hyphomicrobiaceae bacterium]